MTTLAFLAALVGGVLLLTSLQLYSKSVDFTAVMATTILGSVLGIIGGLLRMADADGVVETLGAAIVAGVFLAAGIVLGKFYAADQEAAAQIRLNDWRRR